VFRSTCAISSYKSSRSLSHLLMSSCIIHHVLAIFCHQQCSLWLKTHQKSISASSSPYTTGKTHTRFSIKGAASDASPRVRNGVMRERGRRRERRKDTSPRRSNLTTWGTGIVRLQAPWITADAGLPVSDRPNL